MFKIFSEATIIGLVILLIGKIVMGLTISKKNKKHPKGIDLSLGCFLFFLLIVNPITISKKNKKHPKGIDLSFFFTGFLLHFVIEYFGLNCWYCDKKCMTQVSNFTT